MKTNNEDVILCVLAYNTIVQCTADQLKECKTIDLSCQAYFKIKDGKFYKLHSRSPGFVWLAVKEYD